MASLSTSIEKLDNNKVRLSVAVPADEFELAVTIAFRKLAREVRIPGFRPGKAPRALLESRLGSGVAREQALRDALPDYYATAVATEAIDAIASPEIDITAGEESGDVKFDAVVEVRPVVKIKGYEKISVSVADTSVPKEAIAEQIDALRERFADLEDSSNPLTSGDYAQIDIKASSNGEAVDALSATDYLYEVGSARVVPELDSEILGKNIGDIFEFTADVPIQEGDAPSVSFQVLVKSCQKKVLPELSSNWVSEVSEFATVAELEADTKSRLDLYARVQAQLEGRDKILESLANLVSQEAPEPLVAQEMERRLHDLHHRLEPQGVTVPQYLAATGQNQETFIASLREGCGQAVRADLALRAVVAQESIVVADTEVESEIEQLAQRMGEKPDAVKKDLQQRGLIEAVQLDLARGKAVQFLIDHATVTDAAGNVIDMTPPEPPEAKKPEVKKPEVKKPVSQATKTKKPAVKKPASKANKTKSTKTTQKASTNQEEKTE
ncbi:MAG: trigger factor [Acidimicrobiia bacterium]|nr:trigger factor [Acidimicrobiia bacterium]